MSLYGGVPETPEEASKKRFMFDLAKIGKTVFAGITVGPAMLIIATVLYVKFPVVEMVQNQSNAYKAIEDAERAQALRDIQYTKQSLEEERYKKALATEAEKRLVAATGG